jgi:hypothetical protein
VGALEKIQATEFLGEEFATWLYWLSETHSSKMKLDGVEEFELWFEAPVELVCDFGEATNVALKGGTPLESPEARQALRENKMVAKAALRVLWRNQTFTFTFRAQSFSVSGLKVPVPPNAAPADYLHLRLEILQEFEAFFQKVFEAFLKVRLNSKAWTPERKRMVEWVKAFDLA